MDKETWKDIKGFEGKYAVSNLGSIKSHPKTIVYRDGRRYNYSSKVLSPFQKDGGYPHVNLFYATGKAKTVDIHRVVAETFIPNPENKPEVNHKDGDKSNNHFKNLEWATSKENKTHGFETGLYSIEKLRKASILGGMARQLQSK